MKVLFVASECAPLVKVGGLADVVGGLPKALKKLGADVAIVLPKYENLSNWPNLSNLSNLNVDYAGKQEQVLVYQTILPDTSIPVYLFENPNFLSIGPVYSAKSAEGTSSDIDRFSFFSKAVVEFLSLKSDLLNPDIIHCHDWHTSWIPLLVKSAKCKVKSLLTIHNMGKQYQGRTGWEVVKKLGISPSVIASTKNIAIHKMNSMKSNLDFSKIFSTWQSDNRNEVNILLQGIVNADLINTVSPTYAREIKTQEYGEGLNDILGQYQDKLFGILNGIDYDVWNPQTDRNLVANYSFSSMSLRGSPAPYGAGRRGNLNEEDSHGPLRGPRNDNLVDWQEGKKRNKMRLLQTVGLPSGENIPTFGMVTRIAEQKGFDILIPALEKLFSTSDARVIILGVGDPDLEFRISNLEFKYKDKLKFITRFDEALAHLIYSGSDFFLVPSRFEPSGLTQLIAMRYGTLPIVRKTGGLSDSVEDGKTGFVLEEYTSEALLEKLEEAINSLISQNALISQMVQAALQKDFSWDSSAKEYLQLYQKLA